MLEYWYKEKRTLLDFRRGPLGPHLDAFAAYLKDAGYSAGYGQKLLGTCCQFNAFLIEQGITHCSKISRALTEPFLDVYLAFTTSAPARLWPRLNVLTALNHLFGFLIHTKVLAAPKLKNVSRRYQWLLAPYLQHLQEEGEVTQGTVCRSERLLSAFLEALGKDARRKRFKALQPETVERFVSEHLHGSSESPHYLGSALRRFFRYCATRRFTSADFSGLIPSVRRYRYAALPKGIDDAAWERVLNMIPKETPTGARDRAILLLMMAYGIRGVSVAQLLLDDIDWTHSRIRIRAQKGGKEVLLPLMEAVGESLIGYLQHRRSPTPCREVFLRARAPYKPLNSGAISMIVRRCLQNAHVQLPNSGARTLRHSWAIRALAHNSAIKAIADVLGHRYINTTFIYAKADLKALRGVAMPWPGKK